MIQGAADVERYDILFLGCIRSVDEHDVVPLPSVNRSFLCFIRTTAAPDLKIRVSALSLLQGCHGLRPSMYTEGSMARSAKFEQSKSYLFQFGISEFLKSLR